MKLSVIIVNFNVAYFLKLCLLSVKEACAEIDFEIIVVDNCSSDHSQELISKEFTEVIWIQNEHNLGFGSANNLGVKRAKGEFVLLLNPDTVVSKTSIQEVLKFAESRMNLGAVGVRMIDGGGNFLPESKRKNVRPIVAIKKLFGMSESYYANNIGQNEVAPVEVLAGAFLLIKRNVFKEIKGFDEDFFMYGEDIDLCFRLSEKGYKNYYFGKTSVIHFKGESSLKDPNHFKNFYDAMKIYFKKHHGEERFSNSILELFFDGLTFINKIQKPIDGPHKHYQTGLYLGEDEKIMHQIQNILQLKKMEKMYKIPNNHEIQDLVFFELGTLTCENIVTYFETEIFKNSDKRIVIPPDFLIGSDDSRKLGEVVFLKN